MTLNEFKGCRQYYGAVRKLLRGNDVEITEPEPFIAYDHKSGQAKWTAIWLGCVLVFCCFASCAHAATLDQWADAIGKAENSKSHPYGIMVKYHHTSPRQACKNTVLHVYRKWLNFGHPGAFLPYLASVYAPLNASNDPTGLNRNWINNVTYFLTKE